MQHCSSFKLELELVKMKLLDFELLKLLFFCVNNGSQACLYVKGVAHHWSLQFHLSCLSLISI